MKISFFSLFLATIFSVQAFAQEPADVIAKAKEWFGEDNVIKL